MKKGSLMFKTLAPAPAPTLADAHSEWHAVYGRFAVCPLDCGAGEAAMEAYEQEATPLVLCGHCKGRHTVHGVAVCAATHHLGKEA